MKTVLLFRQNPEILARYQARYMHIQVDEFQDTNLVQYELVKQLAGKYRNICVVGDPDQSIYSWRSADIRNILNFEKDFPDARVVLLEQNYRSTQLILDAASHVISANRQRKPKDLWTENEKGLPPAVIETYSEEEEAQWVVNEIDNLVRSGEVKPGDCAVMYRTNAQSRVLEEAFIRYGMPYKLVAGTRFYERREVKDIIAYLRLIQNPLRYGQPDARHQCPPARHRRAQPGRAYPLGESAGRQRVQGVAAAGGVEGQRRRPPFQRADGQSAGRLRGDDGKLYREEPGAEHWWRCSTSLSRSRATSSTSTGLVDGEERWENVLELRGVAQDYKDLPPGEGLTAFLEGVALVSDVDDLDEKVDTVTLITLHQAKGLEFPVVFIVGMEDGILPHFKSIDDPAQLEEERRLCYVGITRAKKKVYLVRAFRRHLMGSSAVNKPSRFLLDIPAHLITSGGVTEAKTSGRHCLDAEDKEQSQRRDLPEFKAGDHVRHEQFGEGVVVNYHKIKNDAEVVVAFDGAGVKRFLLSFAKIEKV